MKKAIAMLLMLALTLCAAGAMAVVLWHEEDGIRYLYDDDVAAKTAEVDHCYTGATSVIILAKITVGSDEYSVTSIGSTAFANREYLESVTIPDSIESIESMAFYNCKSLTSVTIPSRVTSIGDGAFQSCTGLKSVTIPSSVTSIGDGAFYNCTGLKSVTFSSTNPPAFEADLFLNTDLQTIYVPEGSEEDYKKALEGQYVSGRSCASMVEGYFEITDGVLTKYNGPGGSVVIPGSVTSIGNEAFKDCTSLKSVTIPSSVTSIGNSAFRMCESLTSVTISSSVTSIGGYAFQMCTSLTSVTIPKGVTSIGNAAFAGCTSLKSVTIPSSVTSIGADAFAGCMSLKSVTIPSNVTSIGFNAFQMCTSLTSVTIPSRVTTIGNSAFELCTSLTSVTFSSTTPPDFGVYLFIGCGALQKIYVPEGSEEGYKKALEGQYVSGKPCAELVVGYAPQQPAAAADLPRTGDHSSLALWVALLAISGVGMTMRRREA